MSNSLVGADPIPVEEPDWPEDRQVLFEQEVLPILRKSCLPCHNSTRDKSGLNLETVPLMIQGGDTGPALVPGMPEQSLMLKLAARQEEPWMPPENNRSNAPALTPEQLGILSRWIRQGAPGASESSHPHIEWQAVPQDLQPVYALDVSQDQKWMAYGSGSRVRMICLPTETELPPLKDPALNEDFGSHLDLVQSVRFSSQGLLATGGYRNIKLWSHSHPELIWQGSTEQLDAIPDTQNEPSVWNPHPVESPSQSVQTELEYAQKRLNHSQSKRDQAEAKWKEERAAMEKIGGAFSATQKEYNTAWRNWNALNAQFQAIEGQIRSAENPKDRSQIKLPESAEMENSDKLAQPLKEQLKSLREQLDQSQKQLDQKEKDSTAQERNWALARRLTDRAWQTWMDWARKTDLALENQKLLETQLQEIQKAQPTEPHPARTPLLHATSPSGKQWAGADAEGFRIFNSKQSGGPGKEVLAERPIQWKRNSPPIHLQWMEERHLRIDFEDQTTQIWDTQPEWTLRQTLGPDLESKPDSNPTPVPLDSSPLTDRVLALEFDPTGQYLAAASGQPSRSGQIILWDLYHMQQLWNLEEAHSDTVFSLAISPDGTRIASGGADRWIRIWNLADGELIRKLEGHTGHILSLAWHANNEQIISGSADQTIRIWDAYTGETIDTIRGRESEITAVRYYNPNSQITYAAGSEWIQWQDKQLQGSEGFIYTIYPDPANRFLIAAGEKGIIWKWSNPSGEAQRIIERVMNQESE